MQRRRRRQKDRGPLEILKEEFEAASAVWAAKYPGGRTTPGPQLIERFDAWPAWSFIPRIVKLGTADAEAPYSFEALKWFVELSQAVSPIDRQYYPHDQSVLTLLRTRHAANPRIVEVFDNCSYYVTPAREALLRECVETGSSPEVRGQACWYLAECLRNKSELRSDLSRAVGRTSDGFQKHVMDRWSPDYVAYAQSINADQALAEATKVEQRVIDEFGDVPAPRELPFTPGKPTLGFMVRFRRAQADAVSVGRPAPEIAVECLDGKERKLSTYRGQVVVLHFWASWYGPCLEKLPQLAKLARQHEKQPFCVLGVNYDRDREAALRAVKDRSIAWPSWWASKLGPAVGQWFADSSALPGVLVLDHKGVLRDQGIEGDALDQAVAVLLRELAEAWRNDGQPCDKIAAWRRIHSARGFVGTGSR